MNKRRLDGSELEDGKKRKKAKTNIKDDHGHPLASLGGDQSLTVKAEIIPARTLTRRELRELKNAKKQEVKSLHKQKLAEASGLRLAPVHRPNKLELKNAKHDEGRLKREQGAGTLMARNKAFEIAGGRTRRRKFTSDAKNDQDRSDRYSWTFSDAAGGQMLGLDPIFSLNEE